MTTLATETWTGSNGAAWPAQWTTSAFGAGASATIQSNQGQLVGSTALYEGEYAYLNGMASSTNIAVTVAIPVMPSFATISIILNDSDGTGSTGYPLYLYTYGNSTGGYEIGRVASSSSSSDLIAFTSTPLGAGSYMIKYQNIGGVISFKYWLSSASEPSAWTATVTDSSPLPAGKLSMAITYANNGTVSPVVAFDNLTVTDGSTTTSNPIVATETWTGTTGNAWPVQWTINSTATAGSATIQGGQGQLNAGSATYGIEYAFLSGMSATTDTDLTLSIPVLPAHAITTIFLCTDYAGDQAYQLDLYTYGGATGGYDLLRTQGGSTTSLIPFTSAPLAGGSYNIEFSVVRGVVSFSYWLSSTTQPSSWTGSVTDSSPLPAGKIGLSIQYDNNGTANPTVNFDNLSATGLVAVSSGASQSATSPSPVVIATYEVDNGSTESNSTLTTTAFTPATGELLILKGSTDDIGSTLGTPTATGGAITWTKRVEQTATSQVCYVVIWSGIVTSGGSAITVSIPCINNQSVHTMVLERYANAQIATNPATVMTNGSGTATTTLTTTAANSVVTWVDADWSSQAPGTPTYNASATSDGLVFATNYLTSYNVYQTAATAGAQTLGIPSSGGQTFGIAGLEIQYTASVIGTTSSLLYLGPTAVSSINVGTTAATAVYIGTHKVYPATVTSDTTAPSAPTNVVSSNVSATSFALAWTAATDNVAVASYDIYLNNILKASTTALSANLTDLIASTAYTATVKAIDAAGNISAASTSLAITTSSSSDTTAPSAPTNVTTSAVTSTTATVSWTASTDNVGVTGYNIYLNGTLNSSSSTTSGKLTGLSSSTTYTVTVKAYDAAGNLSTDSTGVSMTTATTSDTTAPSTPTNVTTSAVTSTTATVSWTASTDNVGVTGYHVYLNGNLNTSVTSNTAGLSGLSASTSYTVTVKAYDAAGNNSAASTGVTLTTAAAASTASTAMPTGNVVSNGITWKPIFSEDYLTAATLGNVLNTYPEMGAYDGFNDTSGQGEYSTSKTLTVHDSALDIYQHSENGQPYVGAVLPDNYAPHQYVRASIRYKTTASGVGYKFVMLFWPSDNTWNDGEIDWPEADLTKTPRPANAIPGTYNTTTGNMTFVPSTTYPAATDSSDWHIATTEWTVNYLNFYWDGALVYSLTTKADIPSVNMRLTFQAETFIQEGTVPTASYGHTLIDWVVIYSQ